MTIDGNHIIAEEGKVFRRISDGMSYGTEIYLGKTWYMNGAWLDVPHDDVPEDFEEVDEPTEEPTESE